MQSLAILKAEALRITKSPLSLQSVYIPVMVLTIIVSFLLIFVMRSLCSMNVGATSRVAKFDLTF